MITVKSDMLILQEENINEYTNLYLEFNYARVTKEVYWFMNFLEEPFGSGKIFMQRLRVK